MIEYFPYVHIHMYASLIKAYAKFYRLLLFRSSPKRVLIDTYSRVLPMIGIGKLCLSSLQFLIDQVRIGSVGRARETNTKDMRCN